jgi:stage III sporulation protein SpoIIIAA
MMVASREQQAEVLVQAVQNHNPDVIIVDEIGTKAVRGFALWKCSKCSKYSILFQLF